MNGEKIELHGPGFLGALPPRPEERCEKAFGRVAHEAAVAVPLDADQELPQTLRGPVIEVVVPTAAEGDRHRWAMLARATQPREQSLGATPRDGT